ncbi:MAG TPA: translocation/assembly module TamB domain-containing protein [Gemmatimonadaceae bacterium]|jgi:translocation and assembly module TamB
MTRRKLVALVAALVLCSIGLVVVGTGLFLTRTDYGRAKIRDIGLPLLQRQFPNAKLYVGKVSGSLIGGVVIDSIALSDLRGELFASTGRLTLEYNWRDLFDYRVFINRVTVEHPYVHIIQHATGRWNFKEIFASNKPPQPEQPRLANTRGWGDYLVFDSVAARNTTFILTMPWTPDSTLHGSKRDSVINVHLTNPEKAVTRTFDGFGRNYVWKNGNGVISHVRLTDPDSNKFGKEFKIANLSVDEYVPTFQFRNLRGVVKLLGDSVWMDIPHFELPASVGHGKGKVWWGSDLPVRYDIAVRGDSVALNDVNWVYPTLPREGGGTVDLGIKNDSTDLHVVDFRLQNMDMRTTGSHLVGDMWFGTGAPDLLIRHVNLKADPVSFDFIRVLNGKPFPYDWRGDIVGTVKARGGTQRHFVVDDAQGTFQDAHVNGAVSRFTGNGELDILNPSFTTFHHFNVDVQAVDLRTIEFLNKNFPRLGGIVYGTATLDSVWLDVRFSNASLYHQDGAGEPTHVTGEGRVTTAAVMEYDLSLTAEPLNATMLARSKPFEALPIRGLFSGPLRLRGTAPDLEIATSLQSAAGSFSFDGRADIDSIGGYGAHGHGEFSSLNLSGLLEKPDIKVGLLNGHYDLDVDSIDVTPSSVRGSAQVALDRTVIDSIRVHPSDIRVRFADGKIIVDSASIRTDAFTADLRGAVGLPQGTSDSLRFTIDADSLGGLRSIISHPRPAPGSIVAEPDSLAGELKISNGVASGTLDALNVRGKLAGDNLAFNAQRVRHVDASFDIHNALTPDRTGTISADIDTLTLATVVLDSVSGSLTLRDSTHRAFGVWVASHNGPTAMTGGTWTDSGATQLITLDSLRLEIADSRWGLTSPARIVIDSNATRVDSMLIHNLDSGFVSIIASVPAVGNAFAQLRAHAIPLADVGVVAQLSTSLRGSADLSVTATGTRAQPMISGTAKVSAIEFRAPNDTGIVRVDSVTAIAAYNRQRLIADVTAVRNGAPMATAHASWPFDITLFSAEQRNDSVDARLALPSFDLAVLAELVPSVKSSITNVGGSLSGFLAVGGTTAAKVYSDSIRIAGGAMTVPAGGVSFTNINGTISGGVVASGLDSTHVAITAHSSDHDTVAITGFVQNLARLQSKDPNFNLTLTADSIHAYNRRTVADVYFSTPQPLRWVGTPKASVLTGQIVVDRGAIFLSDPDLARKLAVETIAENRTRTETSAMVTDLMKNLVIQAVPVTLGSDVRLKSSEADVRLSGQLELVKSNTSTRLVTPSGEFVPGLTLNGSLSTVGGTYTLRFTQAVQRQFTVLPNGVVTFDGSSPETPLIDIKAQYTVRRQRDRDLNVIVNLTGRLPTPQLSFQSDNDYTLEASDLLSYLVIGQPGFDFTNNGGFATVGSFLSPTLSALAADALRNTALGSFGASFQLELGQFDNNSTTTTSNAFQSYLRSASLDLGVPLYKNLFLGVNAGACLVYGQLNSLGAKIEYRFRPDMSLQASYDPAQIDNSRGCTDSRFAGLVPSVAQFSFAVRKTWRF